MVVQGARRPRARAARGVPRGPQMSLDGINFLKCAFASPDFDQTGARGVPDMYSGRSLTKNHVYNSGFTFPNGQSTYIIVVPSFGTAFLSGSTTTAGLPDILDATYFADAVSMGYVGGAQTQSVSAFRTVSLAAEIQPTVNSMTWTGNISCARFPLRFEDAVLSDNTIFKQVTGMTALANAITNGFNGQLYTAPFNAGVYCASLNRQAAFDFVNVQNNADSNTPTDARNAANTLQVSFATSKGLTSFDTVDSIVIRVAIPTGDDMTGILKIWECNEYVPNPGTALYEFSHPSADYDPVALMAYKRLASKLPIAVGWRENARFWETVMNTLREGSAAMANIPGVFGFVGSGINALSRMFQSTLSF